MIRVIGKALDIIELLASDSEKEFGLGEIADTLGMDHGTCANIIKSLSVRGYADQTAPRKGYKLGFMCYKLSNVPVRNEELTAVSIDEIEALGRELNETVYLSVIRNDSRVVLHNSVPDQELTVRMTNVKSVYAANTARVILANLNQEKLDRILSRIGIPDEKEWPGIRSRSDLIMELVSIRKAGYLFCRDSNHIAGYAVPVFRNGEVVASLGVFLPEIRLTAALRKKILPMLKESASRISATLSSGVCESQGCD